jgi:4-diphosphocytidyl-2-C-methyl-D-erythritol kinase
MQRTKVRAYAKINLTLEIVGMEAGYHLLDSLVASIDLFDSITAKKRKGTLSRVTMYGMGSESIPPEQNNALKAAEAYSKRFGCDGAEIIIHKNIPIGGGLGGSSADIAGVLRCMQNLYAAATEEDLYALACELGSDVRYMLEGGYARMQGRGERITPIKGVKEPLHLLLICPEDGVSAGACYRAYDEQNVDFSTTQNTEKAIACLCNGNVEGMGRYLTNALYVPAAALNEEVKKAMAEGESFSPIATFMTGSGSTVCALFETKELCDWAKSRYRGKFHTIVVKTVAGQQKQSTWHSPFVLGGDEL